MRLSETGEPKENKQKIKKDIVVVLTCAQHELFLTRSSLYTQINFRSRTEGLKTMHKAKGRREGRAREKSVITGQLRFVVCRWIMFKDMQRAERGSRIPNSKDLFLMKTFWRPLFEWHVSWSSWIPVQSWVKGDAQRRLEDANLTKARQSLETVD